MKDFTPTTEQVQGAYAAYAPTYVGPRKQEFDRWFAEELRKAKEEAWKEGMNYAMPPDAVLLYSDNPYRKGE